MRLVIDLQPCQGENRHRGIGRYSLGLAKEMARRSGPHEVWLMLNDLSPENTAEVRRQFEGLLPPEQIAICRMPSGVGSNTLAYTWRVRAEEAVRQAFLEQLRPDVVHVASLFEDVQCNSAVRPGSTFPSAITLYDIIPWMRPEAYLGIPVKRTWYERKLGDLRRAELLLAISEHTRREVIDVLNVPGERIVNIMAAAESHFRPVNFSREYTAALRRKFGVTRPFVMYTGGIDSRKNIEGLIEAYSLLPAPLRARHQLAIVCAARESQKRTFQELARGFGLGPDEVVFTGYVTDDEMTALYNLCALFVFPSLHEGFGLPALEALSCGAPVIVSNTSSLPEVVGRDDALFDPARPAAIAEKMARGLADEPFRRSLREHAPIQAAKFSWAESGRRAWAALEQLHEERRSRAIAAAPARPRLAYVSPLPPERTGIADYSAELLPALAEHYDIDLVVNQAAVSHPALDGRFEIHDVNWFEQNARNFDRIVYQMGNSQYHRHMFGLLRRHPGTVVLHDFYLGRVIEWMEDKRHAPKYLSQQLRYAHGETAVAQCKKIGRGNAADVYPCNKEVLDLAAGVIVHSRHAVELGRFWYGEDYTSEWTVIPPAKPLPEAMAREAARARLGLAADGFYVVTFGFVSHVKENDTLLEAWLASSLARDGRCRFVFVGENHGGKYGKKMLETIRSSGAGDRVAITGFVSPEDFSTWMFAADAAVQLRKASRGETSAAALNCLAHGLPLIVNDIGSMAELPVDAVHMLPEKFNQAQLIEAMEMLHADASRRRRLAVAGVEHVRRLHDPAVIAQRYRDAVEQYAMHSRQAIYRRLIRNIAEITEPKPDEDDLIAVASSIAGNHPHRGTCRCLDDGALKGRMILPSPAA